MNGHDNLEFNWDHLKPLERAARIFCDMNAQNPDEQMAVPHPMLQGVALHRPAWHFAAEALLNLNQMLVALRRAAEPAPAANDPATR